MADRSIPTSAACPELRRVFHAMAPLFPFPPPCTRGDTHPATRVEAASVRASLVSGAACMGPQHPVESSHGHNLRATPRKQGGPLKLFASSEPKLSYKLTSVWEQATAPAARTNRNFPRSQIASNLLGATRQPKDEEGAGGFLLHPHADHLPRASRPQKVGTRADAAMPLPEILLWTTPSEPPRALQASECSELLDPTRASCLILAQRQPGKYALRRVYVGVNTNRPC